MIGHRLSYDCLCMIEALEGTVTEAAATELSAAAAKRWTTEHVAPFGCQGRHRYWPACSCGWEGREKFELQGAVELGRWHKRNADRPVSA